MSPGRLGPATETWFDAGHGNVADSNARGSIASIFSRVVPNRRPLRRPQLDDLLRCERAPTIARQNRHMAVFPFAQELNEERAAALLSPDITDARDNGQSNCYFTQENLRIVAADPCPDGNWVAAWVPSSNLPMPVVSELRAVGELPACYYNTGR
jgi:hypothetical protein